MSAFHGQMGMFTMRLPISSATGRTDWWQVSGDAVLNANY
jgi:hypothetical protein